MEANSELLRKLEQMVRTFDEMMQRVEAAEAIRADAGASRQSAEEAR